MSFKLDPLAIIYLDSIEIENDDKVLLYLLQHDCINEKTARTIPESWQKEIVKLGKDGDPEYFQNTTNWLEKTNFIVRINKNQFYLNDKGKNVAIDAFLEWQEKIHEIIDLGDDRVRKSNEAKHKKWIKKYNIPPEYECALRYGCGNHSIRCRFCLFAPINVKKLDQRNEN
jgi:hypothetical protein